MNYLNLKITPLLMVMILSLTLLCVNSCKKTPPIEMDKEQTCGYSPDEEYLSIWKNPNSIPYRRLQFLKEFPTTEIYNFERLEFVNNSFEIKQQPFIENGVEPILLNSIRNIPITAHIVRRSNGTGGLSENELENAILSANDFYNEFNMNFYLCKIIFIDTDAVYNNRFSLNDDDADNDNASFTVLNVTSRNVAQTINVYFVPNSSTSWTWRPRTDPLKQHIMMLNRHTKNGVTLSHEIGHWFALLHTHGADNDVMTDELVNGSNCETAGDFVCDTPADPNLRPENLPLRVDRNCNYIANPNLVDANREEFYPDTRNVMSYTIDECRNRFSEEQILRMQSAFLGMQEDRGYFFGNRCEIPTLDATFFSQKIPSTSINVLEPLNVSITMQNTGQFTWSSGYKLESVHKGLLPDEVSIGETVEPNETITIKFQISALSPGIYKFQWRMSEGKFSSGRFGASTRLVQITVNSKGNNSCDDLHEALQSAKFSLADWQAELSEASPSQKPFFIEQIRRVQGEIEAIEAQLQQLGCN